MLQGLPRKVPQGETIGPGFLDHNPAPRGRKANDIMRYPAWARALPTPTVALGWELLLLRTCRAHAPRT